MKKLLILLVILLAIFLVWEGVTRLFPNLQNKSPLSEIGNQTNETIVETPFEENFVIEVVENAQQSVVTIGVEDLPQSQSPTDPFDFFFGPQQEQLPDESEEEEVFIGSGFVASKDGLIVTNKHVVSDANLTYVVIDNRGNKYPISNIYRDPLNDIAIVKVDNPPAGGFKPLQMGDSSKLKVGQFVVAIGTPLGEFTNSVTMGVVSGLGRGVTAGSPFQGFVERLDNVIQTDAAINPGNSGGPLLNSQSQVIGVNTAISGEGQNIGFAIPINTVKTTIQNFNETGQFNRPFLGVSYSMITEQSATLNEVPEGALVREVVPNSTAARAGIQEGDIITEIDGSPLDGDNGGLAGIISQKKVGDTATITVYREGQTFEREITLEAAPEQ